MLTLCIANRSDYRNMEKKDKQTYLAPSTLVFEVVQEGVICQSPGGVDNRDPYIPTDENPFGN